MEVDKIKEYLKQTYHCGTLVYTIPKLAGVFIWVMLGFLVFNICTTLPARMLPIQLADIHASDTAKMIILTTIGGVLNMTVCPYVGFVSDRKRSKWGRRIPYILYSLPFICISLLLFAFTDKIGPWFSNLAAPLIASSPAVMTVAAIAIVMFMYQFYYMYVGSVIYYLANDIIPKEFFGQIMAAINIAVNLGNTLFFVLIYGNAKEWYREIFVVGAIVYGVGTLLMCLFVKEGEYPPNEGENSLKESSKTVIAVFKKWLDGLLIFIKESFASRIYVLRYLLTVLGGVGGVAFTYSFFLRRELNIDLAAMGQTDGYAGLINLCAYFLVLFVFGVFVSRWHPVRIIVYNVMFGFVGTLVGCRWLLGTLTPNTFVITSLIIAAAGVPLGTIVGVAGLPFEMLTFPKSRFGSFCSMQALLRSTSVTIVGLFFASGLDFIQGFYEEGSTVYYRYTMLWPVFLGVFQVIVGICLYREWNRLGGYKNYACPAPWSSSGQEALEQPEYHAPSVKYLKLALFGFDILMVLTLLLALFWTIWYWRLGQLDDAKRYIWLCVTLSGGGLLLWIWIKGGIMRDIKRCLSGILPHNGIPHHGMLLLVLPYYIVNTLTTIYYIIDLPTANGTYYLALFCFINIVLVSVVYILTRMERNIVTTVEP